MTRLYSLLTCTTLALLSGLGASAQDLKLLDYTTEFKKNGITQRVCKEVKYAKTPADTLIVGVAHFDQQGRMFEYHEYFAGGRIYAIYQYGFNEKGVLSSALVKHVFNQMEPIEMDIEVNGTGKVTALTLREPIRNFWQKQTFTYNSIGVMIRSEQWFDRDGKLTSLNRKEYPAYLGPSDNSLTHLFDQRGLEIVHQFYGSTGQIERAWLFMYQ